MNPSDALQALRDIHLPDPVPFWPPAPGWWLLALLIVLSLVGIVWFLKHWRRSAHRRAAMEEWRRLRRSLDQGRPSAQVIADLSILLRRAAMSRYGRRQVAGLSGASWLEFLDRTGHGTQFSSAGRALLSAPYHHGSTDAIEPLLALARDWLSLRA